MKKQFYFLLLFMIAITSASAQDRYFEICPHDLIDKWWGT